MSAVALRGRASSRRVACTRHPVVDHGAGQYPWPVQQHIAQVGGGGRRALRDPHLVSGTLARQRETAQLVSEAAGFKQPLGQDPRW
jgi:hypothetical protein